jgi:ATP-dependent RNA helicase RhlE
VAATTATATSGTASSEIRLWQRTASSAATPAPARKSDKSFADLGLADEIVRAVHEQGYTAPTPIQEKAVPYVLAGRDLLGCAQTGTGKTAAFAMPMLQRLTREGGRGLRALVLTPTRELAIQVAESFTTYGKHSPLTTVVVFGGVGIEPQKKALARHPDILVATPGRLLDLMGQRAVSLHGIKIFVLDEADRMLDMGFIHDVKKVIAAVPKKRQTLLFSATMPKDIVDLAMSTLDDPAKVEVAPVATTTEQVTQSVYYVNKNDKRPLLLHIVKDPAFTRVLVFTRTKHVANRIAELLTKNGIKAEAIHGNKSQSARQRALEGFRKGTTPVLVASDLAARGLDIDEVSHVINFELPNVPETYVHRIGRTGRADHRGLAISFCDAEERPFLRDIERLIRKSVPVVTDHPYAPKGCEQQTTQHS